MQFETRARTPSLSCVYLVLRKFISDTWGVLFPICGPVGGGGMLQPLIITKGLQAENNRLNAQPV